MRACRARSARCSVDKVPSNPVKGVGLTGVNKRPVDHRARALIGAPQAHIAECCGSNIATVAAVRKLLTLVYYGLRDGHIRCLARAAWLCQRELAPEFSCDLAPPVGLERWWVLL